MADLSKIKVGEQVFTTDRLAGSIDLFTVKRLMKQYFEACTKDGRTVNVDYHGHFRPKSTWSRSTFRLVDETTRPEIYKKMSIQSFKNRVLKLANVQFENFENLTVEQINYASNELENAAKVLKLK